jgi:hypothetical protein
VSTNTPRPDAGFLAGAIVAAAASALFAGLRSDFPWLLPIAILTPTAIWLALAIALAHSESP